MLEMQNISLTGICKANPYFGHTLASDQRVAHRAPVSQAVANLMHIPNRAVDVMITGIFEIDIFILLVGLVAWIFDKAFNDGNFFASLGDESSKDQDSNPTKGRQENDPSERQRKQLVKCSMDYCNSLSFRDSEYCWKHQDGKRHETDGPGWWEEGGASI